MLRPDYTSQYKKDIKLCEKRNYNIELLKDVIALLLTEELLPAKYREHLLLGNYSGYKECHILPNWLLIYKIIPGDMIIFTRTGTHTDLF
jgi:mRNA interferase YafQ